jgi:hypothetical protein
MAIGKCANDYCFSAVFFEARFHAYVELSYYFRCMFLLFAALGVWAAASIHPNTWQLTETVSGGSSSSATGAHDLHPDCTELGLFFQLHAVAGVLEAALSLCIAVVVPSIMRSKWYVSKQSKA